MGDRKGRAGERPDGQAPCRKGGGRTRPAGDPEGRMTIIMVPPHDAEPWPTLGPGVCEFIEERLCHGPGDLLCEPVDHNDEQRGWIYRLYEVYPEKTERRKNGVIVSEPHPMAGKRRFQRGALSLRKGSSKTEFAAWIAGVELHPDGPVRCAG